MRKVGDSISPFSIIFTSFVCFLQQRHFFHVHVCGRIAIGFNSSSFVDNSLASVDSLATGLRSTW